MRGNRTLRHALLVRLCGALLIMLGLIVPLSTPSISRAAAQGNDGPLDLPAMVLTPWDIADAGLESYGHTVSETLYLDGMVERLAAEGDVSEGDMREALENAGFVRAYYAWYSPPAEDGEEVSSHAVASYLFEFEDEDGAADAWEYLETEADDSQGDDVGGFDDLGDASEATLIESDSTSPYIQLDVTVLSGNLHIGMAMIDWSGEEPDEDVAAELADYALERVDDGLDADQPALSNLVVRLAGGDVNNFYDMYRLRDGEAVWTYDETAEDAESRLEDAEDAGMLEGYRLWQRIAAGSDERAGSVLYYATLYRFEDDNAAAEFVVDQQDGIEDDENYTDIEIDDADYGDGGFIYSAVSTGGEAHYRGITFQSGDLVVSIDVGGPIMPTEDAVASIADEQLDCIDDEGCLEPVELPFDLEDYVDEVAASNDE